jgi:predicted transcriptional regulator
MYHIERTLKRLCAMVGNKGRVEGCIAEEHNVNAPTMRYHVNEDPPCSNLGIFQNKGTTVGASTSYDLSETKRKAALHYMYANMPEMHQYFK